MGSQAKRETLLEYIDGKTDVRSHDCGSVCLDQARTKMEASALLRAKPSEAVSVCAD